MKCVPNFKLLITRIITRKNAVMLDTVVGTRRPIGTTHVKEESSFRYLVLTKRKEALIQEPMKRHAEQSYLHETEPQ